MSDPGRRADRGDNRADVGAAGPAADPGQASLRDFVEIMVRRWATLAVVTGIVLAAALAYIFVTPTVYTASTSILLSTGTRPLLRPDAGLPLEVPDATLIESQVKLIVSEAVLRRVVDQEHLVDDEEFVPTAPGLKDRLFAMLGFGSTKSQPKDRRTLAIMALGRDVGVQRSERTYVLDLTVTTKDAVKSARLADEIALAYLDDQQAARAGHADATADYLKTRVEALQSRLIESQAKVEAYKRQHGILGANGKLIDEEELSALSAELTRARVRTADARANYQQVQRVLRAGRIPDSVADALKSPTIERLRSQYAEIVRQLAIYQASLGARHPSYIETQQQLRDTRELITRELKRLTDAAYNQYQLALASETQIAKQAADAGQKATDTNQALVHLRELQRQVDADQADYDRALRARETVKEAGADLPSARIVASASIPLWPSAPKRLLILSLALIAGLFFGVAGAALREFAARGPSAAETAARPPRDAVESLAVIGAIPHIGSPKRRATGTMPQWLARFGRSRNADDAAPAFRPLHEFSDHPDSAFSGAIRNLSSALSRGSGRGRAKVVLITSDEPGAGKSTIATNLVRAAGERGERALLIEGNPANPTLSSLVTEASEPALIELAGVTRICYRVETSHGGSFELVPILADEDRRIGELRSRPSAAYISGIKGNFEFVVIDGPSIGADETASLVAEAVDQVVLVMPPTARPDMVEDALGRLRVPTWKFRGTVLSKVDHRRAA